MPKHNINKSFKSFCDVMIGLFNKQNHILAYLALRWLILILSVTYQGFRAQCAPWGIGLASVKDGPRNLLLKFGQNKVSNSLDILILTNVNGTNVAWTNITETDGICSK